MPDRSPYLAAVAHLMNGASAEDRVEFFRLAVEGLWGYAVRPPRDAMERLRHLEKEGKVDAE